MCGFPFEVGDWFEAGRTSRNRAVVARRTALPGAATRFVRLDERDEAAGRMCATVAHSASLHAAKQVD